MSACSIEVGLFLVINSPLQFVYVIKSLIDSPTNNIHDSIYIDVVLEVSRASDSYQKSQTFTDFPQIIL